MHSEVIRAVLRNSERCVWNSNKEILGILTSFSRSPKKNLLWLAQQQVVIKDYLSNVKGSTYHSILLRSIHLKTIY